MDRTACVSHLCPLAADFLARCDKGQEAEYLAVARHPGMTATVVQDAVRKDMFEHVLLFLSSLRCWDEGAVEKPWATAIVYTVDPRELMDAPGHARISSEDTSTVVEVHTDERGESNGILVQHTLGHMDLQTMAPDGFGFTMQVVRRDRSRRLLKRGAMYESVAVEKSKTFEYRSTYVWKYTLRLRWTSPSVPIQQEGHATAYELPLTFRNPPTCHVTISCTGVGRPNAPRDTAYLTDSFLCKLLDVLPPAYKPCAFPLYLPARPQSQSTASKEEGAAAATAPPLTDEERSAEATSSAAAAAVLLSDGDGDDDDDDADAMMVDTP